MPTHLSMPDPCPHLARLDLIRLRLQGGPALEDALVHLDHCKKEVPKVLDIAQARGVR